MNLYDEPEFCCWGRCPYTKGLQIRDFNYWGIQYTHKGSFSLNSDYSGAKIYNGPCVFLSKPGHHYVYGSFGLECRYHNYVTFRGKRVERYLASGLFDYPGCIPVSDPELFLKTFQSLYIALGKKNFQRAVNLLDSLFFQMEESIQDQKNCSETVYYHRLTDLSYEIMNHPKRNWDFQKEAEKIGISYSQFRRLFRNRLHYSPRQYVLNCIFEECATMIYQTDRQISDIAQSSGFSDMSFFARQFKKKYGVTPLKYRQIHLEAQDNSPLGSKRQKKQ